MTYNAPSVYAFQTPSCNTSLNVSQVSCQHLNSFRLKCRSAGFVINHRSTLPYCVYSSSLGCSFNILGFVIRRFSLTVLFVTSPMPFSHDSFIIFILNEYFSCVISHPHFFWMRKAKMGVAASPLLIRRGKSILKDADQRVSVIKFKGRKKKLAKAFLF